MIFSEFSNLKVSDISVTVPSHRVPVETFNETFGEDAVREISEMTGIKSVYRAGPRQTASDLGYAAAINSLQKSEINPNEIGILIFVTQKPDFRVPSTSFLLHKRLSLSSECICFDINLACSGYIYGLHTALSMLQRSNKNAALIITGDTSVRTLSPSDRTMIMLFGDSGTATLIRKTEQNDSIYTALRTDGKRFKSIITPAGAYRNMDAPKERVKWGDGISRSDYDTHMKGMDVFGFSITDVPKLIKEFMLKLDTSTDSYDSFVLHQANMYILKQISRKIKIPVDKLPVALDRYGNNSSNSIPLALTDKYGNDSGSEIRILMSGFGAGLSWGCCDLKVDVDHIYPIVTSDEYYIEQE